MTPEERKKITVIHKYVVESFTEGDWYTLGQLTGKLSDIQGGFSLNLMSYIAMP